MGGRQAKLKKHTAFMVDFISDFVNGEIDRFFFDLDYSGYVIEHYPHMEYENEGFAQKFADTINTTYNLYSDLPDEEFRVKMSEALNDWLN
ncbi:MAG: hypothetical protein LBQ95_07140 [Lachnospiraceae bacterium]|jgi:hypothetical protein|nr:hypothetical protein [Lachnospiraceae bacterium]